MFHRLIENIASKWQAITTNKTKPIAIKTTGHEKTKGYVCDADDVIIKRIEIDNAPTGTPNKEEINR